MLLPVLLTFRIPSNQRSAQCFRPVLPNVDTRTGVPHWLHFLCMP